MIQFNHYSDWKEYAEVKGATVENNGGNIIVAHINGFEIGEWNPNYSNGLGYFYTDQLNAAAEAK